MITPMMSNVEREAGGSVKEPSDVFIIIPCSTNSDDIWACIVWKKMPVIQIGNILIRIFSSSTSVTVHRDQGFEKSSVLSSVSEITAALSR